MEDNDCLHRGETDLDNKAHVYSHNAIANVWLSTMKSGVQFVECFNVDVHVSKACVSLLIFCPLYMTWVPLSM